MKNIYSTTKITIDGKTYKGAAIGFYGELEKTEKEAIKNLFDKLEKLGIKKTNQK